eukprot:2604433-Alexandrium_andersonii.AAC.1
MADTDAVASVPSCKHHILCVRVCGGRQRRFVACQHTHVIDSRLRTRLHGGCDMLGLSIRLRTCLCGVCV